MKKSNQTGQIQAEQPKFQAPTAKQIKRETDHLIMILRTPHERLAKDYVREMTLKNNAYSFIVREGLMDKFVKFCHA